LGTRRSGFLLTEEHHAHILVVEDDTALREILADALNSAGYETSLAAHGITASQMLRDANTIDIVLLDIGLPFVDGWQILEQMDNHQRPAVIVISARGEESDKIRALDLGADDYLAKPFSADELLARIRAVLRRVRPPDQAPGIVVHGSVRVDLAAQAATRDGNEVRLSPTEWLLLAELARNAGVTLDHRTLLQRVWGPQYADERNYLRTFAQRLRVKLEDDPAHPEIVVTVGRQGYRFGPPR
jgi:two-component system, OmpR family, KDP operon response regulator KdpE